ncbi:MAG: hypothetical protein LC808_29785, partial [Actinobacteria bacterium]|nr:hypothetical protein [Actinomycetota bacterium]
MEHEISGLLERGAVRRSTPSDMASIIVRGRTLRRRRSVTLIAIPIAAILAVPAAARFPSAIELFTNRPSPTAGGNPHERQGDDCFTYLPVVVFLDRDATKAQIDGVRQAAGKLPMTRGVYLSRVSKPPGDGSLGAWDPKSDDLFAAYDPPK